MRVKRSGKVFKLNRRERSERKFFGKFCTFPPNSSKLRSDYLFSFQKRTTYLFAAFSRSNIYFQKVPGPPPSKSNGCPLTSGFHGALSRGAARQQGTLTLPDTLFHPFWNWLMLQLLIPVSELDMSFLDFSQWTSLGTFSILLSNKKYDSYNAWSFVRRLLSWWKIFMYNLKRGSISRFPRAQTVYHS